mmetsp:Transcript_73264/g.218618  ORF Transcript_73264/g.218618 Transcript_73264/m.218618 type:complete len:206 (-) Transcript_73264:964-1581(-)
MRVPNLHAHPGGVLCGGEEGLGHPTATCEQGPGLLGCPAAGERSGLAAFRRPPVGDFREQSWCPLRLALPVPLRGLRQQALRLPRGRQALGPALRSDERCHRWRHRPAGYSLHRQTRRPVPLGDRRRPERRCARVRRPPVLGCTDVDLLLLGGHPGRLPHIHDEVCPHLCSAEQAGGCAGPPHGLCYAVEPAHSGGLRGLDERPA